jgi:hypothetical protein
VPQRIRAGCSTSLVETAAYVANVAKKKSMFLLLQHRVGHCALTILLPDCSAN